jgi:hypothetical protein
LKKDLVLEAGKSSTLVVAVRGRIVVKSIGLTADLSIRDDGGQLRRVIGSAKGGALVAVASLRIRHD